MKLPPRPALLAALLLAVSGWAAAQQPQPAPGVGSYRPVFAPVIDSIQVQADAALEPGSSLQFTVRGTPGGEARVRLPGPDGTDVALSETGRGVYTGSYTVRRADRIDPMGALRSSLTVGPATSVTQHWFPASLRDAQAHSAPVSPPSTIAATPLPPLGQPAPAAAPTAATPATAASNVTLAPVITYKPETQAMGAPTAPQAPLWLEVLSPAPNASVDIGDVVVRGRTLPNAEVRVQVVAVPQAPAGAPVVAQPVMLQTVRADAAGEFNVTIGSQRAPPGTRYDVLLRASDGTRSTPDQRLVLIHRG